MDKKSFLIGFISLFVGIIIGIAYGGTYGFALPLRDGGMKSNAGYIANQCIHLGSGWSLTSASGPAAGGNQTYTCTHSSGATRTIQSEAQAFDAPDGSMGPAQ